jgi:hypothetical protein
MFNADNHYICCNLEEIRRLATESIHNSTQSKLELEKLVRKINDLEKENNELQKKNIHDNTAHTI